MKSSTPAKRDKRLTSTRPDWQPVKCVVQRKTVASVAATINESSVSLPANSMFIAALKDKGQDVRF